jgi:hypothetical protein
MHHAKTFTGLTKQREQLLKEAAPILKPSLSTVTERISRTLQKINSTAPYIAGRVNNLKKTHLNWLECLFKGPFDEQYTQKVYQLGLVHARLGLPVEFISGSITLIDDQLAVLIFDNYNDRPQQCQLLIRAVNAVMGFSLMILHQSYQSATLAAELERYLTITGISRNLFVNLACANYN